MPYERIRISKRRGLEAILLAVRLTDQSRVPGTVRRNCRLDKYFGSAEGAAYLARYRCRALSGHSCPRASQPEL